MADKFLLIPSSICLIAAVMFSLEMKKSDIKKIKNELADELDIIHEKFKDIEKIQKEVDSLKLRVNTTRAFNGQS